MTSPLSALISLSASVIPCSLSSPHIHRTCVSSVRPRFGDPPTLVLRQGLKFIQYNNVQPFDSLQRGIVSQEGIAAGRQRDRNLQGIGQGQVVPGSQVGGLVGHLLVDSSNSPMLVVFVASA